MTSIADSEAHFDPERMLAQHQAALTILQGMLSNPKIDSVRWLDLGSGRGQIIAHLKDNLSERYRGKLSLVGYDIENTYTRHAERIAKTMSLAACKFCIGELGHFTLHPETAGPWHFVTITNVAHEIQPHSLASVFVEAILRLDDQGLIFIYDMDRLPRPELGAVMWTAPEIATILLRICEAFGCTEYEPAVGTWRHRTCNGWNAQLNRAHMQLPDGWQEHSGSAIEAGISTIRELLVEKRVQTSRALESLTHYPPETGGEGDDKEKLLYDYWAISRALEQKQ